MKRLLLCAALMAAPALTACSPAQVRAWAQWNSNDPAAAQAFLATPEAQSLINEDWDGDGLVEPEGLVQADRLDPPAPAATGSSESSNGQCVGYKGLLAQYNPGWSVDRMAQIMYRESRCDPGASNSCCSGLLQMHRMHVPIPECGVYSRNDLYNAEANICAAAQLFRASGYGAWSTS